MTHNTYTIGSTLLCMEGFNPAEYERTADEEMASVMPESWDGHRRLEDDNYPYSDVWSSVESNDLPAEEEDGGFVFGEVA